MVFGQTAAFFTSPGNLLWKIVIVVAGIGFISLLIIALLYPLLRKSKIEKPVQLHAAPGAILQADIPVYKKIAVALEFGVHDNKLLAAALGQANKETSFVLIHIVESASARILGIESDDMETRKDNEQLNFYKEQLKIKGFASEGRLGFRNRAKEIVLIVKETNADMLVIGAHGHSGIKDWIYGETINTVRHELKIPVFIVNL
jgi:manganese transport protein